MQLTIIGGSIVVTDTLKNGLARPVVSMCCITYNHVDTIAQCLDGMLMQEVDVPVEIVVHDDASTDGTAEIVADYAARYPYKIRPILRKENQFSQGKRPAALAFGEALGNYMALCEGDDFWTDPTKIARQLAVLEAKPEIDLCAHAVTIWKYHNGKKIADLARTYPSGSYASEDVIRRRGISVPTPTIFVRKAAAEKFIEFVADRTWLRFGDVYLKFFGAQRGGIYFIDREMATYREEFGNAWSVRYKESPDFVFSHHYYKMLAMLDLKPFSQSGNISSISHVSRESLEEILRSDGISVLKKIKASAVYFSRTGSIGALKSLVIHFFK